MTDPATADKPKQKKPRKPPTRRMKKVAAELVESGGNKSVSQAMRDAGYSPATAKNPSKVTRSEAFIALLDEMGVSDSRLVGVLNDGLDAQREVVVGSGNDATLESTPDYATRHKYLETGLRLRGLGKTDPAVNVSFNNFVSTERKEFGF